MDKKLHAKEIRVGIIWMLEEVDGDKNVNLDGVG